ncbi:MAG: right-handed parallel beta-helix repeat-containing protein [Acidimicrobiales bacterium]
MWVACALTSAVAAGGSIWANAPATVTAPPTIAADCSTDTTGVLTRLLDQAPDGRPGQPTRIRLAAGGCYLLNGTLRLADRRHLLIDGQGAILRWPDAGGGRGRRHWRLVGGRDLAFANLTVEGPHPNPGTYVAELDNQHGFAVLGVAGFSMDRVTVRNVYGDFVYLGSNKGPQKGRVGAADVVIVDSNFAGSGRQGITLSWVDRLRIESNRFAGVARTLFDDEATDIAGGGRDVVVRDNDIGDFGHHGYLIHGKGTQRNVRIEANRFTGEVINVWVKSLNAGGKTKRRVRRTNVALIANVSDTPAAAPVIDIDRTDGVIVRDNHQPGTDTTRRAIRISDSTRISVGPNQTPGYAPSPPEFESP